MYTAKNGLTENKKYFPGLLGIFIRNPLYDSLSVEDRFSHQYNYGLLKKNVTFDTTLKRGSRILAMADERELINFEGEEPIRYVPCWNLHKNGLVVLKGRICKIVETSSSGYPEDSSSKVDLVGVDVLTQEKFEGTFPSTERLEVPIVKDYQLICVGNDGFVFLESEDGDQQNLKLPEGDLGGKFRSEFEKSKEILFTVQLAGEVVQIIDVKVGSFEKSDEE
ncbi:eukaryotic translation initiation factor 5A-like isoform X2 [Drosophila bipectinata]